MEKLLELRHPTDYAKYRTLTANDITGMEPLLVDVMSDGRRLHEPEDIEDLRRQRKDDEERLDSGVRRLINPHVYHVSLSKKLWDLKQRLINAAKQSYGEG